MENFGSLLKSMRQTAGFTQKQLADRLGVSKTTVGYYEQSVRYPPSDILIKISGVFHVSMDELIAGTFNKQTLDVSGLHETDISFLNYTIAFLRNKNSADDKNPV